MVVGPSAMVTERRLGSSLKPATVLRPLPTTADSSELMLPKAPHSISVTLSGMVTLFSWLPKNASLPIFFKVLGRVTEVIDRFERHCDSSSSTP